jgi:glyoxylase-like metal-dependent hydrolase (beta-lactamase superfamily II)
MFEGLECGGWRICYVADGHSEMPNTVFPAFNSAEAGVPHDEEFRLEIGAFVIRRPGRVVLVDTGSAGNFGPNASRFHQSLAALGIGPDQVDQILITHLHSDHYGGLLGENGEAAFPQARLVLSRHEWQCLDDPKASAACAAVGPYEGRVDLVGDGDELASGLKIIALPGHTPGHIGLEIDGDDRRVLVLGDVIHCPAYQLPHPDWTVIYDNDPHQAAATRRMILGRAAADQCVIVGAHMGALNPCRVKIAGDGFEAVGL